MRDFYEDLWERLPEQLVPPDLELRLAHLRGGVRAGDRVLDLGCGDGRFTAELEVNDAGFVTLYPGFCGVEDSGRET